MTLRSILQSAAWLLPPSAGKNSVLRRLGHDVHPSATAAINVVWKVTSVELRANSRLGRGNLLKNMRSVVLEENATIGRLNLISSHPVYKQHYPDGAALHLGASAKITGRHSLDCSGGVRLGAFSSVAGRGTTFLSHSIDVRRDAQVARSIDVGDYCFLGSRALLLGGSALPSRSVLSAGSVLNRAHETREAGLWSGVPATHRGPVSGEWFGRTSAHTRRVYVPATGETIEKAF